MDLYTYSPTGDARVDLTGATPQWSRYALRFPSALPTRYAENNTVYCDYVRPQHGSNVPYVVMMHGMSDQLLLPCSLLSRAFARHGIASFSIYSIFHSRRMAQTLKERIRDLTAEEWFESYRISVTDIRQVIDWAQHQPGLSKEKIGVLGISFGGFISEIAMGIDDRIQSGIFIISGGNGEKIARLSRKYSMKWGSTLTDEQYTRSQDEFARYRAEVAVRGVEQVIPSRQSFLIDPLTYAPSIKQRRVLMVNALWDEYIPREATLEFWSESGRPDIAWYPGTHTTIWLWYPLIRHRLISFLRSSFNSTP